MIRSRRLMTITIFLAKIFFVGRSSRIAAATPA
jgi:hypothetical protein